MQLFSMYAICSLTIHHHVSEKLDWEKADEQRHGHGGWIYILYYIKFNIFHYYFNQKLKG